LLYTKLFQKPITILFFLHAQLLCTATATSIAGLFLLKRKLLHPADTMQKTKALLKSIAPYALIILAMTAHNRLDGFLLARLHPDGAYEAGVYAASYRLLDAANTVGYLVASFLVPFLARQQTNRLLINELVLTARYGLLLFGVFASLFLVLFAVPVQQTLYAVADYGALVLQWCLPVLPAYLLLQVYGSLLTAMGQLKPFLVLLGISVVLNVVLNCLLIPRLGAVGCCIAALASQYTCALGTYLYAVQKNELQHDSRQWLNLAAIALLLSALFYAGRQYGVHPLLLLLAGGVVAVLALFTYLPFFKRFFILSS
jgi:O-antigen/teichoic acid export membrane protein